MDLAVPDPSPFVMPVLVGASMWIMQKMTTMPSADERQASTNRMMLWMMPLMFGFFTLNFSSGLAVYWVVSNIIGVAIQGFITGWDPLKNLFAFGRTPEQATETGVAAPALVSSVEETAEDARDRDNGQDGGRGNRTGPKRTRRRSRRGRNRRR
jgi:YidC/Oxa1 family membrane protein insertase